MTSNKQTILEKLFNDQELSKEEIIFISKNLNDNKELPLPFDHSLPHTLEACGLTRDDVGRINKAFQSMFGGTAPKSLSEIVEKTEALVHTDNKFLRMVILQCAKYAQDVIHSPLESLLGKLLKGGPKPDQEPSSDDNPDQ
jgi:hypothetical protein